MPDLALVLQLGDRADRVGQRHRRVGAVKLVQRHLLQPEPSQAALADLAEVLRPAVGLPAVGARPDQAALGRDDQVVRVRVECLGDQGLADRGAVRVGGIDEVDAQLHHPPERGDGLVAAGRVAPDTRTGDPHGPEPQPVDGQVTAYVYGPGRRGGWLRIHAIPPPRHGQPLMASAAWRAWGTCEGWGKMKAPKGGEGEVPAWRGRGPACAPRGEDRRPRRLVPLLPG